MLKFGLIFGLRLRYKFVFMSNACQVQVDASVRYVVHIHGHFTVGSVTATLCLDLYSCRIRAEARIRAPVITYQIAICVRVMFSHVLDAS